MGVKLRAIETHWGVFSDEVSYIVEGNRHELTEFHGWCLECLGQNAWNSTEWNDPDLNAQWYFAPFAAANTAVLKLRDHKMAVLVKLRWHNAA